MSPIYRVLLPLTLITALAGSALAANYQIDWLDHTPTPLNSAIPNASVYTVAGIGNVTLTYAIPATWTQIRQQNPNFTTGNVVAGPDTYSWTNFEYFSTISNEVDLGPSIGTVTYTFSSTLAPGTVYVGAIGLGATTSFGGGTSTTTVNLNGSYLGEFVGDATLGTTQFNPGAGTFSMQNSVTGLGGQNPHWNTNLGVVRIDDSISSITITQAGLRGDGIGVAIGFVRDGIVGTENSSWGAIKSLYR